MKYVGSVTDKHCTPYIEITYYGRDKYFTFPLFEETEYQKKRFYSDDILLPKYKYNYICMPKPWVTGLKYET